MATVSAMHPHHLVRWLREHVGNYAYRITGGQGGTMTVTAPDLDDGALQAALADYDPQWKRERQPSTAERLDALIERLGTATSLAQVREAAGAAERRGR